MTDQIQFVKPPGEWVMRITADRRIEVNEGIDVTDAAKHVLEAVQKLLEQPERKPLTDEAILLAYQKQWHFHPAEEPNLAKGVLQFARAIEQAHGIGKTP